MILTTVQKETLKTHIENTSDLNTLYVDGNLGGLADLLNAIASPAFIVWKTSVSMEDIMNNGFEWARVDNATVGKARIWEWMMTLSSINPSKANIRDGIDQAWSGAANDSHRAAIYAHCKRSATRLEHLFATGTGTDPSPATTVVSGLIGFSDLIGL